MNCFVTGASGFIGANLVHELLARGHRVKALLRDKSDLRGLAGADFERIIGDVNDHAALKAGLRGCDWCFHVAASYHLWLRDYAPMYAANVEGTRNVILAAGSAGCSRIVYTSTVGCIGLPKKVGGTISPTDETAPVSEAQMSNHYKLSKWRAERVALALARTGLPVVIVNPTAPVGPRDVKPTPTGQVIVDFMKGRMPAYIETGMNLIDVDDVAVGHLAAMEKGRLGERYILGNRNLMLREVFALLSRLTGVPAPRVKLPRLVILPLAYANQWLSDYVTHRPPRIPLEGVKMAKYVMHYDCAKAIRELGLPQTPVEVALEKAVRWFRDHNYA